MGINRMIPSPFEGVYGTRRNVGVYFHKIVTTTSGTISTALSDLAADSGLTVAKTGSETGRYTVTTRVPHKRLLMVKVMIIGADDAAYGAVTLGLMAIVRDVDISSDGTFEIQFIGSNAGWADAEIADGASFMIEAVVENG
jgi:hypothetical protein